jgi:hypothetical protein
MITVLITENTDKKTGSMPTDIHIACFAVMLISDVVCNIASIYRRVPAFNGCIKTNPLHTYHQY